MIIYCTECAKSFDVTNTIPGARSGTLVCDQCSTELEITRTIINDELCTDIKKRPKIKGPKLRMTKVDSEIIEILEDDSNMSYKTEILIPPKKESKNIFKKAINYAKSLFKRGK